MHSEERSVSELILSSFINMSGIFNSASSTEKGRNGGNHAKNTLETRISPVSAYTRNNSSLEHGGFPIKYETDCMFNRREKRFLESGKLEMNESTMVANGSQEKVDDLKYLSEEICVNSAKIEPMAKEKESSDPLEVTSSTYSQDDANKATLTDKFDESVIDDDSEWSLDCDNICIKKSEYESIQSEILKKSQKLNKLKQEYKVKIKSLLVYKEAYESFIKPATNGLCQVDEADEFNDVKIGGLSVSSKSIAPSELSTKIIHDKLSINCPIDKSNQTEYLSMELEKYKRYLKAQIFEAVLEKNHTQEIIKQNRLEIEMLKSENYQLRRENKTIKWEIEKHILEKTQFIKNNQKRYEEIQELVEIIKYLIS